MKEQNGQSIQERIAALQAAQRGGERKSTSSEIVFGVDVEGLRKNFERKPAVLGVIPELGVSGKSIEIKPMAVDASQFAAVPESNVEASDATVAAVVSGAKSSVEPVLAAVSKPIVFSQESIGNSESAVGAVVSAVDRASPTSALAPSPEPVVPVREVDENAAATEIQRVYRDHLSRESKVQKKSENSRSVETPISAPEATPVQPAVEHSTNLSKTEILSKFLRVALKSGRAPAITQKGDSYTFPGEKSGVQEVEAAMAELKSLTAELGVKAKFDKLSRLATVTIPGGVTANAFDVAVENAKEVQLAPVRAAKKDKAPATAVSEAKAEQLLVRGRGIAAGGRG